LWSNKISDWVVAPYKHPEHDLPENDVFNNHISMICIQSEHAIGFLKGWFHSLKNLCVAIRDKNGHKIATYWVATCVALHAFAMQCEDDDRSDDGDDEDDAVMLDPFIVEELSSASDLDHNIPLPSQSSRTRLQAGKYHCQKLKERLFQAKARHQDQHG